MIHFLFKLVPFFGGRNSFLFRRGAWCDAAKLLESRQVLRWLPRLNEEFTFGAQEDRDGIDGRYPLPGKDHISHLGNFRKIIDSKVPLKGGDVSSEEGICFWIQICHWFLIQGRMIHPSDLVFKPHDAKLYVSSTWFNHQLIVVWVVRSGWLCLTSCPHNS